jgi:hypothetical protein
VQHQQSRHAERERLTGRQVSVSLSPLRSDATWGNGVEHSGSRGFADTEEVTGSNPVAPIDTTLASGSATEPCTLVQPQREESTSPLGIELFQRSCLLYDGAVYQPGLPSASLSCSVLRTAQRFESAY